VTGTALHTAADRQTVCDTVYQSRPDWVAGTISHLDARYLFGRVMLAPDGPVIEVGTASGVSTAVLATALELAAEQEAPGSRRELYTYDISPHFYADPARRTGDAAREMLSAEALARISFRTVSAASVTPDHGTGSIDFLFLDANHRHPMPAVDLLAVVEALRPGAEVILHDINLPLMRPDIADWGAKHVFDGLRAEKRVDPEVELPNIGSVIIPEDLDEFRDQLLEIVYAHPWEIEVPPDYLATMLAGSGSPSVEAER